MLPKEYYFAYVRHEVLSVFSSHDNWVSRDLCLVYNKPKIILRVIVLIFLTKKI